MRVAIVSDTHGTLDPRVAAVVRACDAAVHAGDIGSRAVLRSLRPRRGRLIAVRGNNDVPEKWRSPERSALASLSEEAALRLPGGELVVVHGDRVLPASRRHEKLRQRYPEARAIVYGHTHRLVCDRETSPWVLNPGAAGRVRTNGGPSLLILDARRGAWRVRARRFSPLPSRAT